MPQDMFSPPAQPAPVTVQGMLPTPGAGQFREMQADKPYVPMQRLGFWPQVGKYVEQGTHQSLAKYFGIADKMGFTDALTEPEFNHIKGERPMLFRPGFSRKTWENEIDAHDVGKVIEGLEINGIDSTFAMVVGSVLGGFTDPVNVAGTYLAPFIGAAAIGANALSRGAVSHILRTEGPEALIKFLSASPTGYFQQVKRAAIFGAAEGALEIPADKYLSELTGQRTYTAADAGLNILTGAALNATIAGVDPAVTGTMRAVQKRWSKTFRETNTFAAQVSAKGINDGTPITVSEVEANVAKMGTYQPSAKRQVERTDGKKVMTPERATPTPQRVKLDVPDVTHASGAPLDFKGDDVSKALYSVAGGNKDVEDQLMRALIDNGTFHADVPSTREALQQAAAEIKTKVDAQGPSVKSIQRSALPPEAVQTAMERIAKRIGASTSYTRSLDEMHKAYPLDPDAAVKFHSEEWRRSKYNRDTKAMMYPKHTEKAEKGGLHANEMPRTPTEIQAHELGHALEDLLGFDKEIKNVTARKAMLEEAFRLKKRWYAGIDTHKDTIEYKSTDAEIIAEVLGGVVRGETDIKVTDGYLTAEQQISLLDIIDKGFAQAPAAPTKPVSVKVDGIPTLARIRDKVVPRAAVMQAATPEGQAMVGHTIRPSDHDLLVGQDYKATHIAAIDNHSNQILKDMEESGDFTPEELVAVNTQANKLAGILDAARVCPTR